MEPVDDLRTRGELLASGFTDAEVRRLRRAGAVATLARGTYLPSDDSRLREPETRHVLRVRAVVPRLAAGTRRRGLGARRRPRAERPRRTAPPGRRGPGGAVEGRPAALRVVGFADGLSESPGESRSRIALRQAGLPAPTSQWRVHRSDGGLVARVDFGWPERRTVGEFDGRTKYGRSLKPGQDPAEAVYQEKLGRMSFVGRA